MAYRLSNATTRHERAPHGQRDAKILSFLRKFPFCNMTSAKVAAQIGEPYGDVQRCARILAILEDMGDLPPLVGTVADAPPEKVSNVIPIRPIAPSVAGEPSQRNQVLDYMRSRAGVSAREIHIALPHIPCPNICALLNHMYHKTGEVSRVSYGTYVYIP
jgi:hypothetical protein